MAASSSTSSSTKSSASNQLNWLLEEMPDECAEKKALAERVHLLLSEQDVQKLQATADEVLRDYRNALPKEERLVLWKSLPGGAAYLEKHSIICKLSAALVSAAFSEWLDLNQEALSSVTALDLSRRELRYVPPEISRLKSLHTLSLDDNKLSLFPLVLTELPSLMVLCLGENSISKLPPEINRLKKLSSFDLTNNNLSTLPPEIGQLSSLNQLGLDNNRLRILALEIGSLENLRYLHLQSNQLRFLPPTIFNLHLDYIGLKSNPLPETFPSTIHNSKILKEYLRRIEKAYKIKLNI